MNNNKITNVNNNKVTSYSSDGIKKGLDLALKLSQNSSDIDNLATQFYINKSPEKNMETFIYFKSTS